MRYPSLRIVLIFPYVTLVVLLALAIGALSYRTGSQAVLTVSDHLLRETVSRIGQAIDRHVVGSVATLEAAFPNGMLAPAKIEDDFDNIRTRFWIATSLHIDPNNYVYYGNLEGQGIGLFRRSFEVGELRIKYRAKDHRKRYRIDGINGDPQYESTEAALFDPRTRPWFQAAEKSDKDIWTSVYIDFGTHDLVATRARRVLGKQGELRGVVATDMPLKALNDFIGNLNISPNGSAFILEPNGDLIASSNSPNVNKGSDGRNQRINAADSGNPLLTAIYSQIKSDLAASLKNGEIKTSMFTSQNGEEIHFAYALFRDNAGLEWINVVALPDRDFLGGISNNVMRTIFLAAFATIGVVFVGLSILNWVTTDLKKLSIAANLVGSGQREEPLNIRRNDEIGTLAKSFQAMQYRLQTDHLTGLPNRYAFEQSLNAAIAQYQETGQSFAVMFVDINDFKLINDRLGHDAGDQALIEIALRLRTHTRQSDLVARYAGDEFVILLEQVESGEDLTPIRKNIEQALAAPLQVAGPEITCLGGAIGIAHFPDDADNAKSLLITADTNMYLHKAECKEQQAD